MILLQLEDTLENKAVATLGERECSERNAWSGGAQASGTPTSEPPQWAVMLGAAGIGLVAGAILAFFQWLVLRRAVRKAGWWLLANSLAWAIGMPFIFWGIDAIQKGLAPLAMAISLAGILILTGAVVGAVEGLFLSYISNFQIQPTSRT